MRAVLPTIGPFERALALRSLPLLQGLKGTGVTVLAQLMREEYVRRGTVLYEAGELVRGVTVLSEGRLRREREGRAVDAIDAPAATGLVEVLAGATAAATTVAATNAVVLTINGAALFDVLEEDFSLLLQIRGELGRQIAAQQRELGAYEVPSAAMPAGGTARPLDLVGRLVWLQHAPVLGEFGVAIHAALLQDQTELRLSPGDCLFQRDAAADRGVIVVAGTLLCTPPDPHPAFRLGPGALVGLDAALGDAPYGCGVTAETAVVAIPIMASVLRDIAEDHFHVAVATVSACARRLLELEAQQHVSTAPDPSQPAAPDPKKEASCTAPHC